jgi:hypothetical protein
MKKDKLIARLPKGWIDRWGTSLARKKKIIKIIEDNFINFGFSALETPFAEISENIGSFLGPNLIGNIVNIDINYFFLIFIFLYFLIVLLFNFNQIKNGGPSGT